jgi:hypothetical protein
MDTPPFLRPGRIARLLGGLALCAGSAAGCGDPPPSQAPAAAPPASALPASGSTGPAATPGQTAEERVTVSGEAAKAELEKRRAEIDRSAHDAIEHFRRLTFDPTEDARLVRASGRIRVDVDGCQGEYAFRFDASLPEKERLTTETVSEESGIHDGSARQALRFAHFAVYGPYAAVLSYLPPVEWQIVRAEDGRMIVVMPPWQGTIGASYRLDDRGIVAMSGTTDDKRVSRTVFTWRTQGRNGVPVLVRATLVEGEHRYGALVDWDEFVRAPADR